MAIEKKAVQRGKKDFTREATLPFTMIKKTAADKTRGRKVFLTKTDKNIFKSEYSKYVTEKTKKESKKAQKTAKIAPARTGITQSL